MTKARDLANLISTGNPLADGAIAVAEVTGAAPLASPTFTGTLAAPTINASTALQIGGTAITVGASDINTVTAKAPLASPTFTGDVTLADKIVHTSDTNTAIRFPANDTVAFETGGSERFRFASAGQLGIAGANYGTSGQVLQSGGASGAASWADAGGGAYELISRTTVSSNASAITYTGVTTSVGVIKLIINNLKVTTHNNDLNLNLIDGSNNILSASNSYRQTVMYHGASGVDGDTTSYSTKISLNLSERVNSDAYAVSGYTAVLYFFGFGSAYTKMFGEAWYNYDDHSSYWIKEGIGAIYMKNTTTAAGLIIQPASGSISSGNVSLLKLT